LLRMTWHRGHTLPVPMSSVLSSGDLSDISRPFPPTRISRRWRSWEAHAARRLQPVPPAPLVKRHGGMLCRHSQTKGRPLLVCLFRGQVELQPPRVLPSPRSCRERRQRESVANLKTPRYDVVISSHNSGFLGAMCGGGNFVHV